MSEDDRAYEVLRLILEHLRSPSLRHIRDAYAVNKLAHDIFKTMDRGIPLWQKWEGPRDVLAKAAATSWIPAADLTEFLNGMAGPKLTTTDVGQRLRAIHEEPYATEKAESTDMPAIVGLLQEHVEREEERLRLAHDQRCRQRAEEDRIALEQRFLSAADCKWTQVKKSKDLYTAVSTVEHTGCRLCPTRCGHCAGWPPWTMKPASSSANTDIGARLGKCLQRSAIAKSHRGRPINCFVSRFS